MKRRTEYQGTGYDLSSAVCTERLGFYASCFAGDARTEDRLCVKIVGPRTTEHGPTKTHF